MAEITHSPSSAAVTMDLPKLAPDLEQLASILEASDEYRVLRRLRAREFYREPDGQETKVGVVLDVETTGLNDAEDKIIELGMVAFEFAPSTGQVYRVRRRFDAFQDP